MAEYERMVSYFYRYQNGMKLDNVGFGKFELRQGRLKVTINMNDNRMTGTSVYRVYLYQYVAGQMRLTELDGVEEQKGGLHFRLEKEASEILKQKSLSQFSGVLVYQSEQLFYGSQWNEDPIRVRGLNVDNKAAEEQTASINQDSQMGQTKEVEQRKMPDPMEHWNAKESAPAKEQPKEETVGKMEVENSLHHKAPSNPSTASQANWKTMSKQLDQMAEEMTQKMKAEEPLTGIPYLLKHRPTLPAFANHEVMQCVRIQPEDIGLLHRDNWEYGNNSFVMHGFYQYRYLLLGCMQYQDGTKQYVIGVPGIYSNKDKYLANIFKFHEFIPMKNCPFRTGEFGYWIGKIKN